MPGAATENADLDAAIARGDVLEEEQNEDTAVGAEGSGDDTVAGADTAAGADDGGDEKPAKRDAMIPKARFDDARRKDRERIKALEEELRSAKRTDDVPTVAQRVKAIETESTKLSDDYQKALDDGDTKKATQLLNQIRQLDREAARIEAAATAARERAIAVEQVRLDMLYDSLEEKYPQLKEGTDEYDQDLVDEIGELRTAFEARGYSSSESLKRAVKYALKEEGAATKKQIEQDVEEAADKAKKAAQDRKAEAVRRNLDVAKRQPADLNKAPGADSHKLGGGIDLQSVHSMSDADFDALPEATKRKLRGDHYAPSV